MSFVCGCLGALSPLTCFTLYHFFSHLCVLLKVVQVVWVAGAVTLYVMLFSGYFFFFDYVVLGYLILVSVDDCR